MSMIRKIMHVAGFAALSCGSMAQAATPVCLTRGQVTSLVTYALPEVLTGTAARCRQALPANAFLSTQGTALARRYAAQKNAYWPAARSAFLTLAKSGQIDQGSGILELLPETSQRTLVDVTVQGLVAQAIPLEQCGKIDTVISLVAPLPPQNMAGLLTIFIDMASKSQNAGRLTFGNIALCKD